MNQFKYPFASKNPQFFDGSFDKTFCRIMLINWLECFDFFPSNLHAHNLQTFIGWPLELSTIIIYRVGIWWG